MKQFIKKAVLKVFNPIAVRLGYNSYYSKSGVPTKASLLFDFYSILNEIGFKPKHIVDIGANHGTWTREALLFFPESYYTLLEPQYWLKDSIKDLISVNPKISFHPVGAGSAPGTFKFTIVDRDDSCSFRYTEEEAIKQGFKQIDIPVVTLNDLLANSTLPIPDIIKIDAEGLDIEVLNGANNFFGKTEIFMVEAAVLNKDFKNTLKNVIDFMDLNGYSLFEVTDLNRPFKLRILWLVELVFVKKGGVIDSKKLI